MKHIDTTNKSLQELSVQLADLREKMTRTRFDHAEKKLKNTSQLGILKRDIARVLTRLAEASPKTRLGESPKQTALKQK